MPMCKKCHDATKEAGAKLGYDLTTEQVAEIMWNCTCYPAGCVEEVAPQVERFFAFKPRDGHRPTLDELHAVSQDRIEREMDEGMAQARAQRANDGA